MRVFVAKAALLVTFHLLLLNHVTRSAPEDIQSDQSGDDLRLTEGLGNVTGYEGETVLLNCEITGSPVPAYAWFKGEVQLEPAGGPRISYKTVLWGSRLKIENLQKQDEGQYRCNGTNRFSTASTEGHLTVLSGTNPNKSKNKPGNDLDPESEAIDPDVDIKPIYPEFPGKHEPETNKKNKNNEDWQGTADDQMGFCQVYVGSSCSKYLGNQSIFVLDTNYQSMHEEWIRGHLSTLEKVDEISFACKQFLVPILCLMTFPTCPQGEAEIGRKSQGMRAYKWSKKLCREDCSLVREVHCRSEYETENLLRWSSHAVSFIEKFKYENIFKILSMANCTNLKAQQWGGPCNSAGIPRTSPYDDSKCYDGDGSGYKGLVHKTRTSDLCLRWSDVGNFYEQNRILSEPMDHNLCRNPDRSMSAPWCFVEAEVGHARELCAIDPCDRGASSRYRHGIMIGIPCFLLAVGAIALVVCSRMRSERRKRNERPADKKRKMMHADRAETQTLQQHQQQQQLQQQQQKNSNFQSKNPPDRQSFQSSPTPPYLSPGNISLGYELYQHPVYGKVYRGEILSFCSPVGGPIVPAVFRTLDDACPAKFQLEFWKEVERVCDFRHPNVTAVLGLNKTSRPIFVAYETSSFGDLYDYLRSNSESIECQTLEPMQLLQSSRMTVLPSAVLVSIAVQVASALEFLHSKNYVHSELNSYNVLVCENGAVKISLVVPGVGSNRLAALVEGRPTPLRWLAPEVLLGSTMATIGSIESDVWSFGILLWEIYSCATVPYSWLADGEAIEAIKSYEILPCPSQCPAEMYSIIVQCWTRPPGRRPSAGQLHDQLRQSWTELNGPRSILDPSLGSERSGGGSSSGYNHHHHHQMQQPLLTPTRLISSSHASSSSTPSSSTCNYKGTTASANNKSQELASSVGKKCYFSNEVYTEQIV